MSTINPDTAYSPIYGAIARERAAQDAKWGEQNHPDGTGQLGATGHEKARLAKRLVDESAKLGRLTWSLILAEEVAEAECESDPAKLREELIQVAAVTAAWIEAIDRRALADAPGVSPVPVVLAVDPGVQVEQEQPRRRAQDDEGLLWWIHDCGETATSSTRPGPHDCDSCGNAPGPWAELWIWQGSTPTIRIDHPDDDTVEVLVDGRPVASANFDDHGRDGMDAIERTALAVARAFGAEVRGRSVMDDIHPDVQREQRCPDREPHEAHEHNGFARPEGVPSAWCPGRQPQGVFIDLSSTAMTVQQRTGGALGVNINGEVFGLPDGGSVTVDVPTPEDDYAALVHYVISEFGPSGATLCGIGIEEDGDLSTTSEAEKGTCRDCRIALGEEPQPVDRLEAVVAERAEAHEREVLAVIKERDDAQEWADQLAQAIAGHLGIDIGEHSNANLPWQTALLALQFTPAPESGPLVLSLPQVPGGAVALIGVESGRRWVPYSGPLADQSPRQWEERNGESFTGRIRDDDGVLFEERRVTVEMTPPREPRTWPKLDPAPEIDDLPRTVDVEDHGRWSRLATHHFYPEADPNGAPLTLAGLRELGEVREVLDGQ